MSLGNKKTNPNSDATLGALDRIENKIDLVIARVKLLIQQRDMYHLERDEARAERDELLIKLHQANNK